MSSIRSSDDLRRRRDQLCSICSNVVASSQLLRQERSDISARETFEHHKTLKQLKDSGEDGCHLCCLLLQSIIANVPTTDCWEDLLQYGESSTPSNANLEHKFQIQLWCDTYAKRDNETWLISRLCSGPYAKLCRIDIQSSGGNASTLSLNGALSAAVTRDNLSCSVVSVINGSEPFLTEVSYPSELSISSDSASGISLAAEWVENCRSHHRDCRRTNEVKVMPKRLVSVGDSASQTSRVVISSEIDHEAEYVTLSYRWGRQSFMKLTTSNIEEFRHCIHEDNLPRTIRDALDITRRLGYKYLWVDSLCILQDSNEDWEAESLNMGRIFCHSVVTIAATASKESTTGCYMKRDPLSYLPCKISGTRANGVFIYHAENLRYVDYMFRTCIDEAPLNQRAWVLQERLLSPRILHFTARGIFWECYERQAFDSLPHGRAVRSGLRYAIRGLLNSMPARNRNIPRRMKWIITTGFKDHFLGESPRVEIPNGLGGDSAQFLFFKCWFDILSTYTGRNMSFASDRLAALTGIIEEIRRATGLEAVQGLWRGHSDNLLAYGMMWIVWEPVPRPPVRRAASWSWVSVDNLVLHYNTTSDWFRRPEIEIFDVGSPTTPAVDVDSTSVQDQISDRRDVIRLLGKLIKLDSKSLAALECKMDSTELDHPPHVHCLLLFQRSQSCMGLVLTEAEQGGHGNVFRRLGAFKAPRYCTVDGILLAEVFKNSVKRTIELI